MERKLATIRRIRDIQPIEGADKIELATVDNWNVVVAKDVGHKVGDMVVYCEVDSFLPIRPEYEFLRKTSYKKMGELEGFRLKTIKMIGQVSQGLILPLSVFGDFGWTAYEGLEVTERLGIVKYEAPIPACLAGVMKGNFPSFIHKTDEERIQNLTDEYEKFKAEKIGWYVTEKLDGSSSTFYLNIGEFGVCSRNMELVPDGQNTFWKVAKSLSIEERLRDIGENLSIQGELIGEGIQGNPYKIKGQTVKFFNLFDIDSSKKDNVFLFTDVMETLKLDTVPVLDMNFKLPDTIEELIEMADGKSVLNPDKWREGIVIRSHDNKISFKVISNKFLLGSKD